MLNHFIPILVGGSSDVYEVLRSGCQSVERFVLPKQLVRDIRRKKVPRLRMEMDHQ